MRQPTPVSRAALIVACAGIVLAGGCASKGTRASGRPAPDAERVSGSATISAPKNARYEALASLGYGPQWNAFVPVSRGQRVKSIDAFDDMIIAHESGNTVSVLEPNTGATRWALDLAGPLTKFTGNTRLPDGDVLSVNEGELFVLDGRSGIIKERQNLAELANTPPIVAGQIVVVGCANGEILGHNLLSGYKLWGYKMEGPIRGDVVAIGPYVGGVSDTGQIAVLDPIRGTSVGRAKIFDGLSNSPASSDSAMFLASRDRSVWAFSATTGGTALWRVRTERPLREQPVYHDGTLYVTINESGLTALDASSGEQRWANREVTGSVVAVRHGRLIVWNGSQAFAVDPQRGDIQARVDLPGIAKITTDSFVDGVLYIAEPSGLIQKFSPRN